MAIAVLQAIEFVSPTAGATSITVSFNKPPTAGNAIAVLVSSTNGGANSTITGSDTESNTYTQAANGVASDTANRAVSTVLVARNIAVSGGVDVTVDFNSVTSWFTGAIVEISGLADEGADQTGTNTGTTASDASVTAAGANAQADMLVLAVTAWFGSGNTNVAYTGPTTGYQPVAFWEDFTNLTAGHCALKIVSASETSSATWTHSNTGQVMWSAAIATFKAAAAGGSVGTADGDGAATGVGRVRTIGTGTAAGVGGATGVGRIKAFVTGTAAAIGSAIGVGRVAQRLVGLAAAIGAATGVGRVRTIGTGTAPGTGNATGVARMKMIAVGIASGVGNALGVSNGAGTSVGTAAGIGDALAVGRVRMIAVGSASGAGGASGVSVGGGVVGDDTAARSNNDIWLRW